MRSASDEKSYGVEFMKALAQFKVVSQEQVKKGMKRARAEAAKGERFLPSGPLFASWCKTSPEELGIESFEVTYPQIQARSWLTLHPAFYHVATKTKAVKVVVRQGKDQEPVTRREFRLVYDHSLLTKGKEFESRRVAKEIYEEVVKRLSKGETFEEPKFLESPSQPERGIPLGDYDPNGPTGNEAMNILLGRMRGKHV